MNQKLKEKLQNIVDFAQNETICKEKPSFASVVFAYKAMQQGMGEFLDYNHVSTERIEAFLTEDAPISRVNEPLLKLGIISSYDENYPYWINYVGDLVAEEFIEEANKELELMHNNSIQ